MPRGRRPTPLKDRFWSRVDRSGECWPWTGAVDKDGYGKFSASTAESYRAPRQAWELANGMPIPAGLVVDHICRVRLCVRPSHLRLVSPRQNALENSLSLVALNALKTHCPQGHAYDAANTFIARSGQRVCRTCARAAVDRYRTNDLARYRELDAARHRKARVERRRITLAN